MAGSQSNFEFWPTSIRIYVTPALNLEARTEFSGLFYIYTKIYSFQTGLPSWPTLITYKVGETGLDISPPVMPPCGPQPHGLHLM